MFQHHSHFPSFSIDRRGPRGNASVLCVRESRYIVKWEPHTDVYRLYNVKNIQLQNYLRLDNGEMECGAHRTERHVVVLCTSNWF